MSIGRGGLVVSSPSAPASSLILFGAESVDSGTATRFLWPFYAPLFGTGTASDAQYSVPMNCTLDRLYIRNGSVAGNGNLIVYTVRKNSIPTALAVSTPANLLGPFTDLVNSVSFVAGDLIDIQVTKALSVASSPLHIYATMRLTP
jgi:hypothetical protein